MGRAASAPLGSSQRQERTGAKSHIRSHDLKLRSAVKSHEPDCRDRQASARGDVLPIDRSHPVNRKAPAHRQATRTPIQTGNLATLPISRGKGLRASGSLESLVKPWKRPDGECQSTCVVDLNNQALVVAYEQKVTRPGGEDEVVKVRTSEYSGGRW
jgi:hypothetical protein